MTTLDRLLMSGRAPRVVGFDDAPFVRAENAPVCVAGVVCTGTRMEGMVWGRATCDGDDATDTLVALLRPSKFWPQVHLVLLDGIAIGGFNMIDLPSLAARLDRPCVAMMRRQPDLEGFCRGLRSFSDADRRLRLLERAGPIHTHGDFIFQCMGAPPPVIARALPLLTDRGKVPEALRLAHQIGAAVVTGQSGRRA